MSFIWEEYREGLVEDKAKAKLEEVLNDTRAFDDIDSGYEVLLVNSGQIQRALRNLDDAIKGKQYAQDAVYTALNYVLESIKTICLEEADKETKSTEEMEFNHRKFGGDIP